MPANKKTHILTFLSTDIFENQEQTRTNTNQEIKNFYKKQQACQNTPKITNTKHQDMEDASENNNQEGWSPILINKQAETAVSTVTQESTVEINPLKPNQTKITDFFQDMERE